MTDNVNHPVHYNSSPATCTCGRRIECIDITRHMGFNIGNAVKYLWRYELKNGLEDLRKSRWYLDDLIKQKGGDPNSIDPHSGIRHALKVMRDVEAWYEHMGYEFSDTNANPFIKLENELRILIEKDFVPRVK